MKKKIKKVSQYPELNEIYWFVGEKGTFSTVKLFI